MVTIEESHELRRRYKPDVIRVLFVAESPPNGRTFFYAGNSNLWRYTEKAFREVEVFGSFPNFLTFFKDKGCYLEDLQSDTYLNDKKLSSKQRRLLCIEGVTPLAERMRDLSPAPLAIVVVKVDIEKYVRQAMRQSGLGDLPVHVLKFPLMQWISDYVRELKEALRQFQDAGILE